MTGRRLPPSCGLPTAAGPIASGSACCKETCQSSGRPTPTRPRQRDCLPPPWPSDPKSPLAHVNRAIAFQMEKKFDEATREFREAIRLKPDNGQTHSHFGCVTGRTGKTR